MVVLKSDLKSCNTPQNAPKRFAHVDSRRQSLGAQRRLAQSSTCKQMLHAHSSSSSSLHGWSVATRLGHRPCPPPRPHPRPLRSELSVAQRGKPSSGSRDGENMGGLQGLVRSRFARENNVCPAAHYAQFRQHATRAIPASSCRALAWAVLRVSDGWTWVIVSSSDEMLQMLHYSRCVNSVEQRKALRHVKWVASNRSLLGLCSLRGSSPVMHSQPLEMKSSK